MVSQWYLSRPRPLFRINQPALTIPTSTAKTWLRLRRTCSCRFQVRFCLFDGWHSTAAKNRSHTFLRDELRTLHNAQDEKLPAVTALAISNKAAQLEPLEIRDLHKLVRDTDKVFPNPVIQTWD